MPGSPPPGTPGFVLMFIESGSDPLNSLAAPVPPRPPRVKAVAGFDLKSEPNLKPAPSPGAPILIPIPLLGANMFFILPHVPKFCAHGAKALEALKPLYAAGKNLKAAAPRPTKGKA